MKIIDEIILYENPDPLLVSKQGIFPGIVKLQDNSLIALFTIGQAFDSADQRTYSSKSFDNGRSWSTPQPLHHHTYNEKEESESLKPLLLQNNKLLAIGYAFVRPDSLTPIVDPKSFEILPLNNKISFSNDNGKTWSMPKNFDVNSTPLEISGPCIQLKSGRIIGAAPPFHLKKTDHSGWIIYSDDEGDSWDKLSEFYNSTEGNISTWECRLCETENKIIVIFWAYDNKNKKNLNNHIVISEDEGKTFNTVIDTKIRGQASNILFYKDDLVFTIHCHRETPTGLILRKVNLSNNQFSVLDEINLFSEVGLSSNDTDISKQFGSLKFGQPSLLLLNDHEMLVCFWCIQNNQHIIKTYIVHI